MGGIMLIVAIMGLFFNIIQMKVLDVENGAGTVGSIGTPKPERASDDDKEQLLQQLLPKEKKAAPRPEEQA